MKKNHFVNTTWALFQNSVEFGYEFCERRGRLPPARGVTTTRAGRRHERRRARLQLQACVWNRPGTLVGTAGGRVGTTSQAHRQRWSCVPRPGLYLARPRPNGVAAKPTGSGRKTSTRGDTLRGDSTWLAHQNVSLGRGRVRCLHDVAFSPPLCLMQLQWIASGRSAFGVTGPWLLRMCTSYGTSLEEVVCAVWSPLGVATIALCLSVDNLIFIFSFSLMQSTRRNRSKTTRII